MIAFILMAQWLNKVFHVLFLNPQRPIDVSPQDNPNSEPEPDFAVLKKAATEYKTGNPPPQDVRLLIEISDSTLAFDLGTRANLYARAEIADYWVVDIAGRRSLVRRAPNGGSYSSVTAYTEGAALAPLAAPHAILQLAAVLPPR